MLGLGEPRAPSQMRPRIVDPYRAFIDDTLGRYPKLLATRLYDMVRERGYRGGVRTLREYVALVRPRPKREAYLVTETLSGEQAQVDWAYVGKIAVPGGERALWVFVIVLAHSRAMWGKLVIDLTVHSLCRSLVRGATAFGGVPRQWLFDNAKIFERPEHRAALVAERRAARDLTRRCQPSNVATAYIDPDPQLCGSMDPALARASQFLGSHAPLRPPAHRRDRHRRGRRRAA